MKILSYIVKLLLAVFLLMLACCEKDEIKTYKEEDSAIQFSSMASQFSFFYFMDQPSMTVSIPVTLIGPKVSHDRTFSARVLSDTTTAPFEKYEVLEGVVKADSLKGELKLKLYNVDDILNDKYTLGLELIEGTELQAGLLSRQQTLVIWDAFLPKPEWWEKRNLGNYVSYITTETGSTVRGVYSTKLYQIMIEVWGDKPLNFYGYLGTTPEILEQYPMIVPGTPIFSSMIRALQQYVYDYNEAHPSVPLRHSKDAVRYNSSGDIISLYPEEPLIKINPYNL
ncbi:DUF4843 domain-containing protein [Dysgonomonas sp. Marseille-P4677]|uniref:DUF4843 domain-containing protein n=1 Tax=Dysgonomonas sp. Marseille-P4677 TaxID=2364790 RepID=UPI001911C084|nr:DUF4843 domain-containing protein [Dysgonomonas sp. Marseille-P4677]MBK5721827.1 DUF4843 domain-containing protein [Dysgonomonas sp. Marseille-P4677]